MVSHGQSYLHVVSRSVSAALARCDIYIIIISGYTLPILYLYRILYDIPVLDSHTVPEVRVPVGMYSILEYSTDNIDRRGELSGRYALMII